MADESLYDHAGTKDTKRIRFDSMHDCDSISPLLAAVEGTCRASYEAERVSLE